MCSQGRQPLPVVGQVVASTKAVFSAIASLVEGREGGVGGGRSLEPVVGRDAVDVAVGERGVGVVGDEQRLQGAADQPRQARHRERPGADSDCARVALSPVSGMPMARANSLPAPRARPRIEAMLTTGARLSQAVRSSHRCIPVGPAASRRSWPDHTRCRNGRGSTRRRDWRRDDRQILAQRMSDMVAPEGLTDNLSSGATRVLNEFGHRIAPVPEQADIRGNQRAA
jgi:hypothetical protein